jgi:hypothetical protein
MVATADDGEELELSTADRIGLLRIFRTAYSIIFLRCLDRLLVSIVDFVGPTIIVR